VGGELSTEKSEKKSVPNIDIAAKFGIFRLDIFLTAGVVYPFSTVYLKKGYGNFRLA
jgi:hypothetical protein